MKLKTLILIAAAVSACVLSCGKSEPSTENDSFTVVFDTGGGLPVPEVQHIQKGDKASEPEVIPEKEGSLFIGWYTESGLKFNFLSNPITKDITLYARYWRGPKKYVVINDYDWSYLEESVHNYFGSSEGKDVAVGQGVLMYIFQRSVDTFKDCIKKHCSMAEKYNIPLLFQLDPTTFWDSVPELWNWWDPTMAGYKESNRENVEWTGWGQENAVKIGWLNWGSQIRLKPMCNWFSPEYQAAVKARMDTLLGLIKAWYDSLPDSRKYLLIGVKITGELGMGVNNWYYTGGNDLYDKPASADPVSGINMNNKPSRSNGAVSTIGYAGLTYSGIKTSGTVSGDDIAALEWKFTDFVSKIAARYFPRDLIFAHAGGVGNDLDACDNDYVCPSWSFYGSDATDGSNASYCMNIIKNSDCPYWGVAEWAISSSRAADWVSALDNSLKIDRCRFLSVYTNVIGNNNGSSVNDGAVSGIKQIQNYTY